ncbi:uncharacterized protein PgNI_08634 [Pyricularia grisea]|uniref:Uncharacterized protein n=1 Tax=Pyricularia grisea TaxID=148305 RepID=A0A6P8AWQ6_PYRGI|nr:uncharacterized protein PgNI_08634 [Pyricularia grisea]TLD06635.1 hypothetical protein PgNI_08634 [Pyricularia grisea]
MLNTGRQVGRHLSSFAMAFSMPSKELLPPEIDFFLVLPSDFDKRWGVYALVLTKDSFDPFVYIGSSRMRNYDTLIGISYPVADDLACGFKTAHKGLLVRRPMFSLHRLPRTTLVLIVINTICSFWF